MNRAGYDPRTNRRVPPRRRKRRMSTGHKIVFAVILILYTALLSAITYFILYKPQGNDRTVVEYVTDEYGNQVAIEHDLSPVEGEHNILVMGLDKAAGLTDVMMLINVNNNDHSITVMQIPRDTYVSERCSYLHKANEVFSRSMSALREEGVKEDDIYREAVCSVAELLEESFCIEITYSAVVNLEGFRNIIDILGGVTLEVPYDMEYPDPVQNLYISIPAGLQTLDGEQSEHFVRFRSDYLQGDLGRVNAQKIFLAALFDTAKESVSITNIGTLTSLALEVSKNLDTDMQVSDMVYMARSLLSCDLSNISFVTLPGNIRSGMSNYVLNRAATVDLMNTYFNTYDKEITTGMFDPCREFVDVDSEAICGVYYADADDLYDSNVYSGEDIDENAIDIPMY